MNIEPKLLTNYKVALKLKNLGYDVPTDYYYFDLYNEPPADDQWHTFTPIEKGYTNNNPTLVSVPELYDVLNWIDSKFDIFIRISSYLDGSKEHKLYCAVISPNGQNSRSQHARHFSQFAASGPSFNNVKDALIAGIDDVLDLIIWRGWDVDIINSSTINENQVLESTPVDEVGPGIDPLMVPITSEGFDSSALYLDRVNSRQIDRQIKTSANQRGTLNILFNKGRYFECSPNRNILQKLSDNTGIAISHNTMIVSNKDDLDKFVIELNKLGYIANIELDWI
jgi:hypothetical protein